MFRMFFRVAVFFSFLRTGRCVSGSHASWNAMDVSPLTLADESIIGQALTHRAHRILRDDGMGVLKPFGGIEDGGDPKRESFQDYELNNVENRDEDCIVNYTEPKLKQDPVGRDEYVEFSKNVFTDTKIDRRQVVAIAF